MNNKYTAILEAATDWLENVDADEFLDDFLTLQEQATGLTIQEFLKGSFIKEAITTENLGFRESVRIYGNVFLDCSESKKNTILNGKQEEKNYFIELNYLDNELKVKNHINNKSSYKFLLDDTNEFLGYAA